MITAYSAKPLARHIDTPEQAQALKPMGRIISGVCAITKVSVEDILGKSRKAPVAKARLMAMATCRAHTNASLHQIARVFRRDHTCVINAAKRLDKITTQQERAALAFIAKKATQ